MNPRRIHGVRRDTTVPQALRLPIIPPPIKMRPSISIGRIWGYLILACLLFWVVASILLASLAR